MLPFIGREALVPSVPMTVRPSTWSVEQRTAAVGLVLVSSLGIWIAAFAGRGAGRPAPVLWLLGGVTAAFTLGWALAWRRGLVQGVVAVSVAGTVALTWPGILSAGGPPTGYANANATLTGIGVLAAIGAAHHAQRTVEHRAWAGLAIALAAAALLSRSLAGAVVLGIALALLLLSHATRWPVIAIVGGVIAVLLALGTTAATALGGDVLDLRDDIGVRGELWTAAADLARDEPVWGVGAGGFERRNPVSGDPDLRWAHHGYLQALAEYGLVGFGLLVAILGWCACLSLAVAQRRPMLGSLGGAAVALVGLHAAVDYVWHIPAVLITFALLFGSTLEGARFRHRARADPASSLTS